MKQILLGIILAAACFADAKKPNIIVIYTDDHGYADLGINGQAKDVKTPNLDRMARDGALCTAGYITAPQCSPSRAGMLTGRHQQRFNFDDISHGPLPLSEKTLADRLHDCGYRTGMIGKWHLEPNWTCSQWMKDELDIENATDKSPIPFEKNLLYYPQNRGFDEYFKGEINRYWINYGLDGKDRTPTGEWQDLPGFRIDIQTDAALAFIERNQKKPFFLYLAYFAPHVPLEATQKYLDRFPGEMPERRRYALAIISAMDDGVGRIREQLNQLGLDRDTLIFFTSDNGAPLKIDMEDIPISFPGGAWDGSLNTPWVGEKGMVMEGGVRVPFIVTWPGKIPAGTVCKEPVSALDFTPTSLAAAGAKIPADLDGVDLMPYLTGKTPKPAERDLYWRFWNQAAIRRGDWKYMKLTDGRERLYRLDTDAHENEDLLKQYPEKAKELRKALDGWMGGLNPAGFRECPVNDQEVKWFEYYLDPQRKVPAVHASNTQAKTLPALYEKMDLDADGRLSHAEFVGGRTSHEKPLLMKKHNLTEEQYQARREGYRGSYRANFKKRDADQDGFLNAAELK
jgi:arylsulfatase A-like enzyme